MLALGGKAAGKTAFSKFVTEAFSKVKSTAQFAVRNRANERIISKFYSQVSKVRLVKTLWQIDKPVDIGTFYCESHVNIRETRKKVGSMADLEGLGNLLIEGIAGQGKSIFLRYLCGVELVRGEYIPILIELRRLRGKSNLQNHVLLAMAEYGLKLTAEEFQELASSGRILLLLDAFDEVAEEDKPHVVDQIEHLVKTHEGLRLIVSSRPNNGLEVSPVFQVVKLSDLERDEYKAVIFKLLEDQKIAGELIKQVQAHHGDVKELLKTPLLVTLLVINYKSFQEVPAQLSGFYDSLFKLLLQRHDGTKPGYRRQRLCALNDTEYRLAFEAFCYLAKQHRGVSYNHQQVYSTAKDALGVITAKDDAEKYLSDIVKITCLIVKDGEEYRFIHKSVQEYYGACFIKSRPDILAEKIYPRLFNSVGADWRQELNFLSEIDAYRFRKFGLAPAIADYLGIDVKTLATCKPEDVLPKAIDRIRSATMYLEENGRPTGLAMKTIPTCVSECINPLFEISYAPIIAAVKAGALNLKKEGIPRAEFTLNYGSVMDVGFLAEDIKKCAIQLVVPLLRIAQEAISKTALDEEDQIALRPLLS